MILDQDIISNWGEFTQKIRSKGCSLLARLDEFPGAILVAGCQRSGTTMLARLLTSSAGMINYWFGSDDELDAALILSGYVEHTPRGRYCFQTTYVDECYSEYLNHSGDFQLIWVLRNPFSVIYSLLYNWKPAALDGTFAKCGLDFVTGLNRAKLNVMGVKGISRLWRACYLYNAKQAHLFELHRNLAPERLIVIDYDELVLQKETLLPNLYHAIALQYNPDYADKIHNKSVDKCKKLTNSEGNLIQKYCQPVYERAKKLVTITAS